MGIAWEGVSEPQDGGTKPPAATLLNMMSVEGMVENEIGGMLEDSVKGTADSAVDGAVEGADKGG